MEARGPKVAQEPMVPPYARTMHCLVLRVCAVPSYARTMHCPVPRICMVVPPYARTMPGPVLSVRMVLTVLCLPSALPSIE
eukprot:647079-Rhodomonas_salina.2